MNTENRNKKGKAWMRTLGMGVFRIYMGILIEIVIAITTNLTFNECLLSAKFCVRYKHL